VAQFKQNTEHALALAIQIKALLRVQYGSNACVRDTTILTVHKGRVFRVTVEEEVSDD